ncbi:hypothetical protein P153DRAFT_366013 [Dothidotthia symphoricarpi CBS 119687]|uniref:Phosphoglycerate mutase-like protein n=1 Tax=Dothidotthia symphoricarpi CBS 119687 TaxID=1392245 RepID=A0A6A6AJ09_9PLEO|nr:uncharacterized protein P153DRAFT_366013 [Dothidotthia symphoricarpi CBS 119687]KAF2130421.1 hypothetical protein P153DRAFT_366013 [Dothidotthia symphoricarpi CBS 119687]
MAKSPAVVVIARHGARLDAADKTWHLTSPTPYDPPLTYGGWAQGKALGLRIAALLHQRDTEKPEATKAGSSADTAPSSKQNVSKDTQRPKKKRKIVIHSSPFLRCVQTSTAVAAGISQYRVPTPTNTPQVEAPKPAKDKNSSPLTQASSSTPQSSQPKFLKLVADPKHDRTPKPHTGPDKVLLRIDAFLGEWLSPDYYEDITPPPNSTLMVAGAKADLLRRGDYIGDQPNTHSSKGHFPGGWMGKGAAVGRQNPDSGKPLSMGSLGEVSPFRERSGSLGSTGRVNRAAIATHLNQIPRHIYDAPAPSYSISSSDPIPRGYVAHAREACVHVDFQWDSMRSPQEWGDGGEYGDEWSTMHKRFRKGLACMMQWYQQHGIEPPQDEFPGFMFRDPTRPFAASVGVKNNAPELLPKLKIPNGEATDEEDEELVLVLVTHGAGCNALLGAITNQPVLMDISLASLSLAARRDKPRLSTNSNALERRVSVADAGMADTYDMKVLASVDHLRPGVDPSKPPQAQPKPQTQSPSIQPSPTTKYKRYSSSSATSSPIEPPFTIGEPVKTWNSSVNSVRRTTISGSSHLRSASAVNPPTSGLWGARQTAVAETSLDGRQSPGADMVLNFGNSLPKPKPASTPLAAPSVVPNTDGASETNDLTRVSTHEEKEKSDAVAPLFSPMTWAGSKPKTQTPTQKQGLWGGPKTQTGTTKLWGPPRLDDIYEHKSGPKRRWTVTEANQSLSSSSHLMD